MIRMRMLPVVSLTALPLVVSAQLLLPAGYWSESTADQILAKTETIRLAPDLSGREL